MTRTRHFAVMGMVAAGILAGCTTTNDIPPPPGEYLVAASMPEHCRLKAATELGVSPTDIAVGGVPVGTSGGYVVEGSAGTMAAFTCFYGFDGRYRSVVAVPGAR